MNYEQIEAEILSNYNNHLNGDYNCIPFQNYGSFVELIPGVERGCYYIITANSGVGKSKLMRNMFITQPMRYCNNSKFKLTIKYFSLEESVKKVLYSEILNELYRKFGIRMSMKQMLSIGENNRFDISVLDKLKECKQYIDDYINSVEVIDTLKKPSDIYTFVRKLACRVGHHIKIDGTIMDDCEVEAMYLGEKQAYGTFSHYKIKDPYHYVIILIDHISLIHNEKGYDKRGSIELLSSRFCINIRDRYGFSVVAVQQQSADRESSDRDNEPSLEGLGDCKTTQRDADVVLGLYNPARYGKELHNGVVLRPNEQEYRSIKVLKNRNGGTGTAYPMRFYGDTGHFQDWFI